ncbi:JmjC domain-containing protein [Burkholderia sp. Z1]|uniref:JmjC domain-containing protein n=1 Tax=Burkholderia sp. Z1 TaxID=2759039 RepID=UPI001867834F|nr:cupin domain-containing protein [Burkholderia sp. Z1]
MKAQANPRATLAKILDPISIDAFLRESFGKRPLLIRGQPGKFDFLMKPSRMIFGLDKVTEIRCVFGGLKQATIGPADIREMYEAGATICVTDMQLAHRSLWTAARNVRREIGFAGRVDFRAYLSPPSSGFDFHYDARTATTLQLDGEKTWWYATSPHTLFPTENSTRTDMAAVHRAVARQTIRKVTLYPGDLLCLPPGLWHKARAGDGGSLALNMAFNHSGATVGDVLLDALKASLAGMPDAMRPFVTGAGPTGVAELEPHIATCIAALRDTLASFDGKRLAPRLASVAGKAGRT